MIIPITNITAIIEGLASDIGLVFTRADQQGDHPAYPYLSYKIINSQIENPYQNIREVEENAIDSTSADVKLYQKSETIVSLSFLDINRIDRIYEAASNALNFLKSIEGKELATTNEIVVQIISPSIEDRTVYQESFFENKIGFDIRFDYSDLYTQTIEGVEEITIENERDGVAQPDIIITE